MIQSLDWTTIIVTLIGGGGLVSLFLIIEKKTSATIKNLQAQADASLTNMKTQYEALQSLYDKLQERFDVETDKVGKLYDEIDALHGKLDAANTEAATAKMKRCDYIFCKKRQPPIADQWRMDLIEEGEEVANED